MLRWALYAGVAVLVVVGVVGLIGFALPVAHHARRSVTVPRPPADVFALITAFDRHPEWRAGVTRVSVDGSGVGAVVRETNSTGAIAYRVEQLEPPARLVMRIVEESAFGGTWTYDLRPVGQGTELTITEDGEIYNPIFRFVARFVLGHHATIDGYTCDLQRKIGSVN